MGIGTNLLGYGNQRFDNAVKKLLETEICQPLTLLRILT